MADDSGDLSPRLQELLAALPDRAFAARLGKVHLAASNAIARLGDLDLLRYETGSVEDSPDLSLWEEMAPVLMTTVGDVNTLLATLRNEFPTASRSPPAPTGMARKRHEAESVLQRVGQELTHQVTLVGEKMRSPQIVSDRWNLLAELQNVRTRLRELIGDLVYETISPFAEVTRREVVPGHAEDVAAAVRIRSTVADLLRVVLARREKIAEAQPEDVQWNAQQAAKELDTFGRTPAYRSLRAQDKRRIIEFRSELGALADETSLQQPELQRAWESFVEFVGALSAVNKRELLQEHDRELLAACGVRLERAESALFSDPEVAAQELLVAAQEAQALYGRDASLDAFLRKARKGGLELLSDAALGQELERLRGLLVSLAFA